MEVLSLAVADLRRSRGQMRALKDWLLVPNPVCFLTKKKKKTGLLDRTDCELKIRSTVTYIASFLWLNLDYTDKGAAVR